MSAAMSIDLNQQWNDTRGHRIEAHGAGLLLDPEVGQRAYWFGETAKLADFSTHGVNCYSSVDLVRWQFEGRALDASQVRGLAGERGDGWIIERPKVLYNAATARFVMWFHLEGPSSGPQQSWQSYNIHAAGVATSLSPCGPYAFVHALRPAGLPSLDATLFKDDDGKAYRVQDVEHQTVAVVELTADYLNATGRVPTTLPLRREGLAMFKWAGRYLLATSRISGWNPNPSEVFARRQLWGTPDAWESLRNPFGHRKSKFSQPAHVLVYRTQGGGEAAIWIADRWCPPPKAVCEWEWCPCLEHATYVWLPLRINVGGDNMNCSVRWVDRWRPEPPDPEYYSQPSGRPARGLRAPMRRSPE